MINQQRKVVLHSVLIVLCRHVCCMNIQFQSSSVIEPMKCSSTSDVVDASLNNGASGGSIGNDQPAEKGNLSSFHAHCSVQTV